MRSRLLPLLLTLLATLALGSCGSDQDSGSGKADQAPQPLLQRGFATDVRSGVFGLSLQVSLHGGPVRSLALKLEGPFDNLSDESLPDVDWAVSAKLDERSVDGRLVAVRNAAYFLYEGEPFELEDAWRELQDDVRSDDGPKTFSEIKVDPLDWLSDLQVESAGDTLGGTRTTAVEGRFDVSQMIADTDRFTAKPADRLDKSTLEQLDDAIEPAAFTALIGADDVWRRISTRFAFTIPSGMRESLGGTDGGDVRLVMTLDEPNQPQRIKVPSGDPEPIANLLQQLGVPTDVFGISPPAAGS